MKPRTLHRLRTNLRSKGEQRGQALVFTLVFGAAAGLVALLLFNSGLLANTKTKLQNTADAAAYSGGVLQARDHNFSAYTNRSIVANQVAVAQMVSIKSYMEDGANALSRMKGKVLWWESQLPSSKPYWNAMLKSQIGNGYKVYMKLAPSAVKLVDVIIKVFEEAQGIHHTATAGQVMFVASEVVEKNDPKANIAKSTYAGIAFDKIKKWHDSTETHAANSNAKIADRYADVVVDKNSTDDFTRNRFSMPPPGGWWASTVKPCKAAPNLFMSFTAFSFAHSGGTQLSSNKKRWLALDATMGGGMAVCVFIVPCPIIPKPCLTLYSPLFDSVGNTGISLGGSGGGLAGKAGKYDSLNGYKGNPSETHWYGYGVAIPPGAVRYNWKGPGATLDSKGGLQETYRDMSVEQMAKAYKDQSPEENGGAFPFTIEIERKNDSIRTSAKILPDSKIIQLEDQMKGNTMRSVASSHAYFYRPKTNSSAFTASSWQRGDNKKEIQNLFSPYWQTRLSETSTFERGMSWAGQK